ncbi:MAG: aldehyde dehydrogenase family protein [Porticoccaceae bacterium]
MARPVGYSSMKAYMIPVVDQLAAAFDAVKPGDPLSPSTEMGCLSTRGQYDKVRGYIEIAQNEGARMVAGGDVPEELSHGFFVRPTVFADVTPDMRIAQEEVFGPVLSVLKWSDYDSLIEAVNGVDYRAHCLGLDARYLTSYACS